MDTAELYSRFAKLVSSWGSPESVSRGAGFLAGVSYAGLRPKAAADLAEAASVEIPEFQFTEAIAVEVDRGLGFDK